MPTNLSKYGLSLDTALVGPIDPGATVSFGFEPVPDDAYVLFHNYGFTFSDDWMHAIVPSDGRYFIKLAISVWDTMSSSAYFVEGGVEVAGRAAAQWSNVNGSALLAPRQIGSALLVADYRECAAGDRLRIYLRQFGDGTHRAWCSLTVQYAGPAVSLA